MALSELSLALGSTQMTVLPGEPNGVSSVKSSRQPLMTGGVKSTALGKNCLLLSLNKWKSKIEIFAIFPSKVVDDLKSQCLTTLNMHYHVAAAI